MWQCNKVKYMEIHVEAMPSRKDTQALNDKNRSLIMTTHVDTAPGTINVLGQNFNWLDATTAAEHSYR